MEALVKSCNIFWVWPGMFGHVQCSPKEQNANICGKGYFVYFLHSYRSMEATVLSRFFSWVWYCMPKVFWNNKSPIFWKGLSDFVDFLQVVICIMLDTHWSYKNMLVWFGIVRHRLSANQIVRCFKVRKLKKDIRY